MLTGRAIYSLNPVACAISSSERIRSAWRAHVAAPDHSGGTTFRSLLIEARQELADQLLADPSIGVDEVACLLGYEDKLILSCFQGMAGNDAQSLAGAT
jgi:hypothetical protein